MCIRDRARVNSDLREMWKRECDHHSQPMNLADIRKQLTEVEKQIANVRDAVMNGLNDVEWANTKLDELNREHSRLRAILDPSPTAGTAPPAAPSTSGTAEMSDIAGSPGMAGNAPTKASGPPQANMKLVRLHPTKLRHTLEQGTPHERKRLVADMVESVSLDPDTRLIRVNYSVPDILTDYIPDQFMNRGGPASCAAVIHKHFEKWMSRTIRVPERVVREKRAAGSPPRPAVAAKASCLSSLPSCPPRSRDSRVTVPGIGIILGTVRNGHETPKRRSGKEIHAWIGM